MERTIIDLSRKLTEVNALISLVLNSDYMDSWQENITALEIARDKVTETQNALTVSMIRELFDNREQVACSDSH